jgi:hypothetical protein
MSLLATGRLRAAQQNDVTAGKDPTADEAQQDLLGKVRALVPSDAVTAFVALIGATSALEVGWRVAALALVVALVPWWVFFGYWTRASDAARSEVRFPLFDAATALIAFLAWSATVPKSPWDDIDGFTPAIGLALTLVVSLLLGAAQQARLVWLKRRLRRAPAYQR